MRKQEFGDPDTLACAAILVVQTLRRELRLMEGIPKVCGF